MHVAMGTLRLSLVATPPTFRVADRSHLSTEVSAPGAVVGASPDCDVMIDGPWERTGQISGFHLILTPSSSGWLITDNASTNGTTLWEKDRGTNVLLPAYPERVKDGMVVNLPNQVSFTVELRGAQRIRQTEHARRPLNAPKGPDWITEHKLKELVDLLARSKRPGATRVPYNKEWVAEALGWSPSTAQAYKRKLAKLPGIEVSDPGRIEFEELAEAVIRAFPELVEPPRTTVR
jgi:pSer/pThr/pTyr-binding forkhead associated (FHA) protein